MTWRILIAELKQETATFNPHPTSYDDFRITRGIDILDAYRGTRTEVSGAVDVFESDGHCAVVPTFAAAAVSGGRIVTADLDRLLDELCEAVHQNRDVDAACLCFHGAMAGEDEGDPEGRALAAIREILGDRPIVVSLDLHAVISDRLVDRADILVPYHTYPHTDHYETGQRAARNLIRLLDGSATPTVARVRLPMLVRGDELLTATGRFGEAIRMCQAVEESSEGLAAGVVIGNAFTDVPALQSNVLVTTNGDMPAAEREAERIGRFMWDHRELFQAHLTPLDEAIQQAENGDGLTVFSDAADATASGAAGDSNAILKGLLDSSCSKRSLLSIVDAPAVAAAFEAGVGSQTAVALGGTRDPGRFSPVDVSVHIKSLHDGRFTYEDGTGARAGRVAVLVSGPISILVTERPVFVVGRRVFQSHGLEPTDFDVVVVKSPNGFRTWYESIADRIVPVDVPGSTSANLKSLPFEHCVRPIFPLDDNVPSPFAQVLCQR
jgi:microcystin degradation protein MlrC